MTIPVSQSVLIIAVVAAITVFTRAVPFLFFGGKREMPPVVRAVAEKLPPASIAILVIYCIKDALFQPGGTLLATLAALTVVAVLHLWKRNTLISIAAGTFVYMILIRVL